MVDAVRREELRIECLPHQMAVMHARKPYLALVTGLGGGKTWTGSRWLLDRAGRFPDSIHVATGNSYRQLQDVIVPELIRAAEEVGVAYLYRKGDQELDLDFGGGRTTRILVRSVEGSAVDKMRGVEIGSWWGDEVRDMGKYAVGVMLGRLRCKKVDQPSYLWTTTPRGFDHIWDRHVGSDDPRCLLIRAKSADNPFLPDGYVEGLFRDYDETMAQQELLGEFVALGFGRAYRAFDRTVHVRSLEPSAHVPMVLSFDFGAESTVVAMQQSGPEVHALREFGGPDVGELAVSAARDVVAPGQAVHVYGDSSMGGTRSASGKTWFALVREALTLAGYRVDMRHGSSNPPVVDRINATNAMLRNAKGETRFFVDPSCKRLIRDYERVSWREDGAGLDKKDHDLTHFSDAAGYYLFDQHRPSAFRSQPGFEPRKQASSRSVRSRYRG